MNDLPAAARIVESAPAVLFAHGYYGTCISGTKMFSAPRPRPCARRFGWRCFIQYYPHRCGGLNPLRMWNDYRKQSARLALLGRYAAILTASAHMRAEFMRHGLPPERVHALRLPLAPAGLPVPPAETAQVMPAENRELRLLYVGRMTRLKGGPIMLDALALAAASLGRPLKVTFVGDGPDRAQWEQKSRRVQAANTNLKIEFSGLLNSASLDQLMLDSDLLVVPSTWPEPFGLVGPEAGRRGLPGGGVCRGWNSGMAERRDQRPSCARRPAERRGPRARDRRMRARSGRTRAAQARRARVVQPLQPRRTYRCPAGDL